MRYLVRTELIIDLQELLVLKKKKKKKKIKKIQSNLDFMHGCKYRAPSDKQTHYSVINLQDSQTIMPWSIQLYRSLTSQLCLPVLYLLFKNRFEEMKIIW